ncbi:PREDICTED: coiled-coil domain-containing protein 142 [Ceratosolen solmsi marchali]|uniref:Coiled-coil domain-containing protein 142 n=1 Tax=Ceratosolen solmsi marchali TaxID=326594 RepID=A0AAJ6YWV8_9HYME|nr:PREDICTED: coiled-coil domain-containing protein 142 [Ceratosolen solmsi marchali]
MDSNYRANVGKWLPRASATLEKCFADSLKFNETINGLAGQIAALMKHDIRIDSYNKTNVNTIARFMRKLINELVSCANEENLRIVFRLVNVYNKLLNVDHDVSDLSINIFHNDCPNMLVLEKQLSITRILKMLAKNRAEEYCHELIDCALSNYRSTCDKDDTRFITPNDVDISDNSSIEIYRTLTKHLTLPIAKIADAQEANSNVENIQALVNTQNDEILELLNIIKIISPYLFGPDTTKMNNDKVKIRRAAVTKIIEFYQEVAWSSVSTILDHVVLWWSPEALAVRHDDGSKHLKDWLQQFIKEKDVPSTVRPALQTLCDALGSHMTVTGWDKFFRLAYIDAFECQSKAASEVSEKCTIKGTDTGQKFVDVFYLLMTLSNECETDGEWIVGAPLIELPLSEQIVVLHRMDHSVHTMRLWVMQETRMIAHTWDLQVFFLLVKGDIVNCIDVLSNLKVADHSNKLQEKIMNVQVYVCAKMRAKIISEVMANIQLLKDSPTLCINILAKIGRVISLTNLHMCFPKSNYWRQNLSTAPSTTSFYVETYFERVLLPVLKVIEDFEISNMILQIMCEAWLDHIYLHKIKFSEWGALQLLTDFAHVLTWVTNCSIISENVRPHLLKNEVLRRCEGVGRLLLRHPGEAISMNKKLLKKTTQNGSFESFGLERMPAEMYVPNQEQWLELRAAKRFNFCCL